MRLSDFDFELPEELIAQHPLAQRQSSRLMVLDRATEQTQLAQFADIASWFRSGDVLVLNDTRVIPARLLGSKETGGRIEVFLVRRLPGSEEIWACLTKSSKAPRPGSRLLLGDGLEGTVIEGGEAPYKHVKFSCEGDFSQMLEQVGRIPLPPYIRREATVEDRTRYQTVFARTSGAVAAPTAGLHFTDEILQDLVAKGVEIRSLTLHVGLGTFLPVRTDDITEHRMHQENYFVPQATSGCRQSGQVRRSQGYRSWHDNYAYPGVCYRSSRSFTGR